MGAPRSDHFHFTGRRKPWFHGPPGNVTEENSLDSPAHFWFYHLEQLNNELDMGLNFTDWMTGRSRRPLLGMYPKYGDVLTSNTNLVGTEQVEDGDENDNDKQSMNATRHNLTSRYASVSHHAYGSLQTSATDTGTSNTNLAGTEQVEDGGDDDNDNDDQSNLTSSHVSVSHHAYGTVLTSADVGTGAVITERMSHHDTAVVTQNSRQLPGFVENAPPSLLKLMKNDPSVKAYINTLQEVEDGSNAIDHAATVVVTQNRVNSLNSGKAATRARTARSHHRHQHHRNSTAVEILNDWTISSEQEIA
jgi:hypothetical protein